VRPVRWTGTAEGPLQRTPMLHASTSRSLGFRPRFLARFPVGLASRLGLICILGLLGTAGCASSSPTDDRASEGSGDRIRVTLKDYRSGANFELVSESYMDRVEYYSRTRNSAGRKFQTDEILLALMEHLEDEGLSDHAQGGRAPSSGGDLITRAFEVERNGEIECWPVGRGSALAERKRFIRCTTDFLELYTVTQSFQAIDNTAGPGMFRSTPEPGTRR
jgi:hypothetical protein